jgi:hypothetical protein
MLTPVGRVARRLFRNPNLLAIRSVYYNEDSPINLDS